MDFAFQRRKLHGIRQEVQRHLHDPLLVAANRHRVFKVHVVGGDLDLFVLCLELENVDDLLDRLANLEDSVVMLKVAFTERLQVLATLDQEGHELFA